VDDFAVAAVMSDTTVPRGPHPSGLTVAPYVSGGRMHKMGLHAPRALRIKRARPGPSMMRVRHERKAAARTRAAHNPRGACSQTAMDGSRRGRDHEAHDNRPCQRAQVSIFLYAKGRHNDEVGIAPACNPNRGQVSSKEVGLSGCPEKEKSIGPRHARRWYGFAKREARDLSRGRRLGGCRHPRTTFHNPRGAFETTAVGTPCADPWRPHNTI
jgi:hypothetical protein